MGTSASPSTSGLDSTMLWAKSAPFKSLREHGLDVGATLAVLLSAPRFRSLRSRLADSWGSDTATITSWLSFMAALHDLGKCHPCFQAKALDMVQPLRDAGLSLPQRAPAGFRHEASSAIWVDHWLRQERGWGAAAARVVEQCLRGHHGDYRASLRPEVDGPGAEKAFDHRDLTSPWRALRGELISTWEKAFQPPAWRIERAADASVAGAIFRTSKKTNHQDTKDTKRSGEKVLIQCLTFLGFLVILVSWWLF